MARGQMAPSDKFLSKQILRCSTQTVPTGTQWATGPGPPGSQLQVVKVIEVGSAGTLLSPGRGLQKGSLANLKTVY
jgi:hypothetical protein